MTHGAAAAEAEAAAEPEGRWARWAAHPAGPALLFVFAVVEGCLFPAPTEALYAAIALGRLRRAWMLAGVAAAGSVLGGVIAWRFGHSIDPAGAHPDWEHAVPGLTQAYRDNAALALVTSGFTPVPYVLYGVAAGAVGMPLATFVVFSALGRGLKYALLAGLARTLGPPLRRWMHRSLFGAIVVVGVIAALPAWTLTP